MAQVDLDLEIVVIRPDMDRLYHALIPGVDDQRLLHENFSHIIARLRQTEVKYAAAHEGTSGHRSFTYEINCRDHARRVQATECLDALPAGVSMHDCMELIDPLESIDSGWGELKLVRAEES